jgi:pyrroline-5-carboxylate reductase
MTKYGFIGGGKMASALIKGALGAGLCQPGEIIVSDPYPAAREALAAWGLRVSADNGEVVAAAPVLVLCVKPGEVVPVLAAARDHLDDRLLISIAAGITLRQMQQALDGAKTRVVRVMPNTPALVGAGAAAYACGPHCSVADRKEVEELLGAVGVVYEVKETLLDAVTGLSGSGPAYVYEIIEALSDGGVLMGLPREVSTKLAAQTLLGAAKMVLETGKHPGELKDMVTSPGGTTIAGLEALEKAATRGALMSAVRAATERARELGA